MSFFVATIGDVHFTAFKYAILPPPMSQVFVRCPVAAVEVCFSPAVAASPFTGDNHCLVLLADGCLCLTALKFQAASCGPCEATLSNVATLPLDSVPRTALHRCVRLCVVHLAPS